jgi:hypothetical protein
MLLQVNRSKQKVVLMKGSRNFSLETVQIEKLIPQVLGFVNAPSYQINLPQVM